MNRLDYSGKLTEMEGLRGIAILMVLLHHFWPDAGGFYPHYYQLAHLGWSDVDLVFVISGFLLDTSSDNGYLKNLYSRRIYAYFPCITHWSSGCS